MSLYTFSPIKNKDELFRAIEFVHFECHKLCEQSFGRYFPNAGNIGIFCHYDDEYELLINFRKEITEPSDNLNQKYFRLHEPIILPAKDDIPETAYTYLYIRKPDPYRHQVGDIDFYLEPNEYAELKQSLLNNEKIKGTRLFDRTDLDMVELHNPDIDALAYVSTNLMAQKVRVKLSDSTNL